VLLTTALLAGAWTVCAGRRFRLTAAALGVLAVLGIWTSYALTSRNDPTVAAACHMAAAAFMAFVLVALLRGIHREPVVTADVVAGALCGYLLVGAAFGHAYSLVEATVPGSFRGLTPGAGGDPTHFRLTYFSFFTLTTVNYEGIAPVKDTAQALVLVESVAGKFYLAVQVADLVGKRVAQALAAKGTPAE
jgi:hypothetical protein